MFLHSGCDFGDTYTRCSFFSLSNINHESFQGCARPGILPESQHPAKWAILFSPFLFFFISSPRNLFLPEMDPVSLLSIVFYRTFLNLLRGMDTFIFWEQKNLRIRRNKTWMWSDIYLFGSGGKIFFNAFRSFEKFGKVIIINIYIWRDIERRINLSIEDLSSGVESRRTDYYRWSPRDDVRR